MKCEFPFPQGCPNDIKVDGLCYMHAMWLSTFLESKGYEVVKR